MDVHHHSHHPKKWKEYISEFFMLFMAVFAGFMAESYLEYRAERHKEHDYLVSLVSDLKIDNADIDRKYKNMQLVFNNTHRLSELFYEDNWINEKSDSAYIMSIIIYGTEITLQYADGTIDQLKNAGGFRLIKSKEITDEVKDYIKDQSRLKSQEIDLVKFMNDFITINSNLFYPNMISNTGSYLTANQFEINKIKIDKIYKKTGNRFLSDKQTDFFKYANTASKVKGYLRVYMSMAELQKIKATKLIKLIEKEIN
jgi:hypothetical protein